MATLFCDPANRNAIRSGRGRRSSRATLQALASAATDWTWQIPVAFAPAIVAAALLAGSALGGDRRAWRSARVSPPLSGLEPLRSPGWLSPGLIRAALAALAVVAIFVGGLHAVAANRLDAGERALADGDLPAAAAAARAAASIEPWSTQPHMQLLRIEQAAGNLEAARRQAQAAIRKAPDDFRGWLGLADVSIRLGAARASLTYAVRARELAPLLLRSEPSG